MTLAKWQRWEVVEGPVDLIEFWTRSDGVREFYGRRALDGAHCFRRGDGPWEASVDSGCPAHFNKDERIGGPFGQ